MVELEIAMQVGMSQFVLLNIFQASPQTFLALIEYGGEAIKRRVSANSLKQEIELAFPDIGPGYKLLYLDEDFEQYLTFDDTSVLYERIKLRVSLTKKLEGKNSLKFSLSLIEGL